MIVSDDAPSAARATTMTDRSESPLHPYIPVAAWTLLGVVYVLWLADSLRTGEPVPASQLNAAILAVLAVGELVTWPRRVPPEVARLAGEVRALSWRIDDLERRDAEHLDAIASRLARMDRRLDTLLSTPVIAAALHPAGSSRRGRRRPGPQSGDRSDVLRPASPPPPASAVDEAELRGYLRGSLDREDRDS